MALYKFRIIIIIIIIFNGEQTQTASEVLCAADAYYLSDNNDSEQDTENE